MTSATPFGELTSPTTLTIQRVLPGTVERVWAYVAESDLRRKWLAAGDMPMQAGASFELRWRNDELTDPPGNRPEEYSPNNSMTCRIIEADPPRKVAFTWGDTSTVSIELRPRGETVLLTLVHANLADPSGRLDVAAGWHAHLDILVAQVEGRRPEPFWDTWLALREDYVARMGG